MSRLGDSLNWVVLAAVLALPAGLYLYWQHNTALKRRAAMQQQASKSAPPATVFEGGGEAPLSNPLRGEKAASASGGPEPGGRSPASPGMSASAPAAAPGAEHRHEAEHHHEGVGHGSLPPAVQDAPAAVETPTAPQQAAAGMMPSTAALAGLFNPKSGRDPMDSAADKLRRESLAADQRLRELLRKQEPVRQAQTPRKKQPGIESRIKLEVIVEAPGGIAAIVNGEMVRKGSSVLGATVVRISSDSVTFNHKGKVFVKKIKR